MGDAVGGLDEFLDSFMCWFTRYLQSRCVDERVLWEISLSQSISCSRRAMPEQAALIWLRFFQASVHISSVGLAWTATRPDCTAYEKKREENEQERKKYIKKIRKITTKYELRGIIQNLNHLIRKTAIDRNNVSQQSVVGAQQASSLLNAGYD